LAGILASSNKEEEEGEEEQQEEDNGGASRGSIAVATIVEPAPVPSAHVS